MLDSEAPRFLRRASGGWSSWRLTNSGPCASICSQWWLTLSVVVLVRLICSFPLISWSHGQLVHSLQFAVRTLCMSSLLCLSSPFLRGILLAISRQIGLGPSPSFFLLRLCVSGTFAHCAFFPVILWPVVALLWSGGIYDKLHTHSHNIRESHHKYKSLYISQFE